MKKYDLVELIKTNKDLENKNIYKGCHGTIIESNAINSTVIVFNEKNQGEYAVTDIDNSFLKRIGIFPSSQIPRLETFLKTLNYDKHQNFNIQKIQEYDQVELLVEKDEFVKYDVHKGDIGCVISPYAIDNKLEVDFTWIDDNKKNRGNIIIVNIGDLKVIK